MARKQLSKRQQGIYEYICGYTAEHGYPPSVREIGKAVGLASPSTVHMHLNVLEDHGYIKRASNKPRTIEVVTQAQGEKPVQSGHDGRQVHHELTDVIQDINANTISLPLVGRVAAGTPILAQQNVEEHLTLPTSLVGDSASFLLRVHGTSMINRGILDGDIIAVHEQHDARDGEVVVARIDDSATVKTFYRESDRIRLQPENDQMEPIYVRNPVILGRVVALVRSFA